MNPPSLQKLLDTPLRAPGLLGAVGCAMLAGVVTAVAYILGSGESGLWWIGAFAGALFVEMGISLRKTPLAFVILALVFGLSLAAAVG